MLAAKTFPDPVGVGDLRSSQGRGQESLAQQGRRRMPSERRRISHGGTEAQREESRQKGLHTLAPFSVPPCLCESPSSFSSR